MFLIHGLKPPTTLDSEMFLNLDNSIHVDDRESLWILMSFGHGCGVNGIQTLGWCRVRKMVSFCWVAQHLPNRFFFWGGGGTTIRTPQIPSTKTEVSALWSAWHPGFRGKKVTEGSNSATSPTSYPVILRINS